MEAIGLNPIRLDRIGLDPIRINAIKLGVPGAAFGTDRPYIDPEVLASLKAVCICYGKSNDDPDRAIVKNLVDPDNPFVISNAAFKLNSGFGKYSADFESFDWAVNISQKQHNKATISLNGRLCNHTAIEIDEMKVNIIGNVTELIYWYIANPDDTTRSEIRLTSGINTLPKSYAKDDGQTYNIGFAYISGDSEITIEQIPSFEGAFVTDGVDDLIISTKTVQEMLGGSNEITVVSMTHKLSLDNNWTNLIGELKGDHTFVANRGINTDKTGIYGYTYNYNENAIVINNILGDKNDYIVRTSTSLGLDNKYYVTGFRSAGIIQNISQIAWYWTFIANRVLTTDEINQVIAYFNLDRTLRPDILCNTIKQGITNENHAEFGDRLIDFSGNGRDIQLNNLAWKGGSGIAAKQYETFKDWTNTPYQTSTVTEIDEFTRVVDSTSNAYWVSMINRTSDFDKVHDSINIVLYQDDMLLVHECKYKIDENVTTKALYETLKSGVNTITLATIDKFTDIPEDAEIMSLGEWVNPKSNKGSVKITLLPSYEGGVLLDGINDFGKVTGMPIYKDYTFIIEREFLNETFPNQVCLVSKSKVASEIENGGAFIVDNISVNSIINPYSFYKTTSLPGLNTFDRQIVFQSKYKYLDKDIAAGTATDSDTLWLGTFRDNDSRFANVAIYSLMSFPYSMSEFLIERQLKKHKLGTLYPDMVEFRPIVKSNSEYQVVDCYIDTLPAIVGNYYPINSKLRITVTTKGAADKVTSLTINGMSLGTPSVKGNRFTFNGTLSDKSPQKINLVISSYLTMLNNETLISNETLIKNE